MLVHLTYWSRAAQHFELEDIEGLKNSAETFNKEKAVTGCLLLINGFFLQTIEGHADVVNSLYAKIMTDPRHHSLRILQYNQIVKRCFIDWLFVTRIDEQEYADILLSYSSTIPFSFDDVTAVAVDQLISEMYITSKHEMLNR